MAINLQEVRTELGNFLRKNNKEVTAAVYGMDVQLNKYARKVTKVKGRYPALHSIVGHVVQGFASTWNAIGTATFKVNELLAYHQKVNFQITPSEVEHSWLAELYDEQKTPKEQPISKHIWEQLLMPRVVDDVNILSGIGVYDANDLATFGKSMNGIQKMLALGAANAENPMYKIALNALTPANILDEMTKYERAIPERLKNRIKTIFCGVDRLEDYKIAYEEEFGSHTLIKDGDSMRSRLGNRTIVGLQALSGTDIIFSTPDGNLLQLIDAFDKPQVTDVQVQDYDVKIFMEFWLGYGFYINQLVLVANYENTTTGLGTSELNELYYPEARNTVDESSAV